VSTNNTTGHLTYPLAADNWDELEIEAMQRVIKSNRYTMGTEVSLFESEVANKFGSKFAVMVNSGSSANLLMLTAAKIILDKRINKNSNIIVPAISWSTTYTPAYYLGYQLNFVDVDRSYFGLNLENVEAAIDGDTVAILAVNLLGSPADLARLKILAKETNIMLLEDNCESLGASLQGSFTGTFGLMGTHSSFYSHHINTMEGGWVTTDHEEVYLVLKSLRAHGWSRGLPETFRYRGEVNRDWFSEQFEFILPGLNFRPLELEAAIGRAQLLKFDVMLEQRNENFSIFKNEMSKIQSVRIQDPLGESSWFAFAMVFQNTEIRSRVANLFSKNGVECRPIVTGNFTRQPVMSFLNNKITGDLDVANELHENGLYIGNHPKPLEKEIIKISKLLISELGES